MKKIPLTQGKFALVDDADYEWLNKWKWQADRSPNVWYARRHSHLIEGKVIRIKMHREILGLTFYDGKQTDHIDHNGLNNQRSNLRVCTRQENGFNQRPQRRITSSRFKGVCWLKKDRKWQSRIKLRGKRIHLGCFTGEIEAAKAYDRKAKELFGEFAYLNFEN